MRFGLLALSMILAPGAAMAADADAGGALFRQNCAPCHGAGAKGDGPMVEILSVDPPDLTALSVEGSFPMADVVRRIDGRDMLLAHGGPMPIFGYILEERSAVVEDEQGTPIFTSQAVLDIAAWLETVQQ